MEYREDSSLWVEKYRPQTIDDCVLPQRTKDVMKQYVASGHIPTMLMSGPAGCGKTTAARAMANELGADVLFINASAEGGVDTVRMQMTQFASTVSLTGSKKVTILDEADGLSREAQQALRNYCEEFSENHSIIFTCNFPHKISDALKSRSIFMDFKPTKAEKLAMLPIFFKRVTTVLKNEGIEFDKKTVLELTNKKFPDFRRCLNDLQKYSMGGSIDSGILLDMAGQDYDGLFDSLKNKRYSDMRKWVAEHTVDSYIPDSIRQSKR
jgi:DNA polymerase III delta prime subunit